RSTRRYACKIAPLRRYRALLEDGVHRAGRLAGAAVDTLVWIDEILLVFLAGVNAIHGTDIHAGCVLHANAGLTDYVGHMPMGSSLQERYATPFTARGLAISYRLRRCLSRPGEPGSVAIGDGDPLPLPPPLQGEGPQADR